MSRKSSSSPAQIASMTGFARVEGGFGQRSWAWEIKSVNGRGLEMRFRLPPGFDRLEPALRNVVSSSFARGAVNANLTIDRSAAAAAPKLNEAALEEAIRAIRLVQERIDCEKPRPEAVLALRSVLEPDEGAQDGDQEALDAALVASFREAVAALAQNRAAEGAALEAVLRGLVDEIDALASAARRCDGASLDAIRRRFAAQIEELLKGERIAEDRLAQEASLLAIKADIREELDRLDAHVAAARELLGAGGAVGRRLDFLSQEFNREANTLCAKAVDLDLKEKGLALKSAIDRMREQIQNIE